MAFLQVHAAIVRDARAAWAVARPGTPELASWRVSCRLKPAARCVTQIQRALAQHEQENRALPVKVRIGAAAGEPVENHLDLFGSTVQPAARLWSHAQPEQILVSNVVAELCIGKGLTFQDLGEVSLNGFDRPIRVHAIKQPGEH
jgi:class 3 adenylate cyclase